MQLDKALWVANAGLVVLLGLVAASIAERPAREAPAPGAERVAAADETQDDAAAAAAADLRAAILGRNVFGVSSVPPPASARGLPVPQERQPLDLRLIGTVAGDAQTGRALISDLAGAKTDLYRVGEVVSGARIERIERNRIYLVQQGGRTILEMQISPGQRAGQVSARPAAPPRTAGRQGPPGGPPPTRVFADRRNDLGRIKSVERLLTTSQTAPYEVDGRAAGVQIVTVQEPVLSQVSGLLPGDVLLTVNGREVTGQQEATAALAEAQQAPSVDIKLLRGGQELLFSYRTQG